MQCINKTHRQGINRRLLHQDGSNLPSISPEFFDSVIMAIFKVLFSMFNLFFLDSTSISISNPVEKDGRED